MSDQKKQVKTVNRIPFPLAVGLTACFSLPLCMFLGKYNLALWVSFIVWAQYFLYGAELKKAARIVVPCFSAACALCTVGWVFAYALQRVIPGADGLWAYWVGFGSVIMVFTKIMDFVPIFREGITSYYNGLTMTIAVLFTQSYPVFSDHYLMQPIQAGIWTIISGLFGLLLGWFNTWVTFPREVEV